MTSRNNRVGSADAKLLWSLAGGRCAFPHKKELARRKSGRLIGHMCHIVGRGKEGPREDPKFPEDKLDKYENLILLCPTHHAVIDSEESRWPVKKLLKCKRDHETWVRQALRWRSKRISEDYHRAYLFILAGPSGVGKDVIQNRVSYQLENRNGSDVYHLQKYTTRQKRADEKPGRPYIHLSQKKFRKLARAGVISCVHTSFDNTYGVDSRFCANAEPGSAILYNIRNLHFLGDVCDRARAAGVEVRTILLAADSDSLYDRINQRTASDEEKWKRSGTARADVALIESASLPPGVDIDHKVQNCDNTALRDAVDSVYGFIVKCLDGASI